MRSGAGDPHTGGGITRTAAGTWRIADDTPTSGGTVDASITTGGIIITTGRHAGTRTGGTITGGTSATTATTTDAATITGPLATTGGGTAGMSPGTAERTGCTAACPCRSDCTRNARKRWVVSGPR